ncbi:hypothetical protein BsWGS_11589 [Bradybaena similaris]
MGNLCRKKGVGASSVGSAGLTREEIGLIRALWLHIHHRATLKETATLFLVQMFEKYPYMREYFPDFIGEHEESSSMVHNMAFRAHAIAIFSEVSKYLDYLEDVDLLSALINKRTRGHFIYGVTLSDMENIKVLILEFLAKQGSEMPRLKEALAAWDKLLTVHNTIFQAKCAELSRTGSSVRRAPRPGHASSVSTWQS